MFTLFRRCGERILVAPYDEMDGWELNVMLVNGTFYLEEHLSNAKLKDKCGHSIICVPCLVDSSGMQ